MPPIAGDEVQPPPEAAAPMEDLSVPDDAVTRLGGAETVDDAVTDMGGAEATYVGDAVTNMGGAGNDDEAAAMAAAGPGAGMVVGQDKEVVVTIPDEGAAPAAPAINPEQLQAVTQDCCTQIDIKTLNKHVHP